VNATWALEAAKRRASGRAVADTGKWRLRLCPMRNWPATMVTPLERFHADGNIDARRYWAMDDN